LTVANTIDRVKQNIRERLEELEGERDQLMRALEALSGSPSTVGRRGRPPGSGAKRSGSTNPGKRAAGRRAPRGQRREQVVAALVGGEKGPSAIAREIGDVNPTQISGLLRQLASEGVVTRTAGGKWRLTATAEHNWAPAPADDRAAEAPGPDAAAPAASPAAE
jgi:hypothetical protein